MTDESTDSSDVMPVVERSGGGRLGLIVFAVALVLGGVWIFSLMNTARQESAEEVGGRTLVGNGPITAGAAPELPERFRERQPLPAAAARPAPVRLQRAATVPVPPQAAPRPVAPTNSPARASTPQDVPPAVLAPRPALPQFAPGAIQPDLANLASGGEQGGEDGERVRARRFASPSLTVPLGTIVPAVLETALDSTRSGSARAIVQQDIFSFDGTRVLIPRGSRLYGEYEGGLERGQNRALVTWTRLMRPDGVTIALASDASDQLGRAGIRGKVDSKFFQRFGGALLQSVLDIGVGVATREATDGLIVALPGSTQNVTRVDQQQVTPTLRVKHGTSISVYVARDLDFSDVDT